MTATISVHIADVGAARSVRLQMRPPRAGQVAGLRRAEIGLAAPLSGSLLPRPALGRVVLVSFWDDERSVDDFERNHPTAAAMGGGWRASLEPLRAFGNWPGLDDGVPRARRVDHEGPALVLTLGRLRLSQGLRFLRTSAKAEAAVESAPGVLWATGFARLPLVATCSLWESSEALAAYAYGSDLFAHPRAIQADRDKGFHKQSAFIRFRVLSAEGALTGRNPLAHGLVGASGDDCAAFLG